MTHEREYSTPCIDLELLVGREGEVSLGLGIRCTGATDPWSKEPGRGPLQGAAVQEGRQIRLSETEARTGTDSVHLPEPVQYPGQLAVLTIDTGPKEIGGECGAGVAHQINQPGLYRPRSCCWGTVQPLQM